MTWIYDIELGDEIVDIEYEYHEPDWSVGCPPEYEIWVYNERNEEIYDQLSDEQRKEIHQHCKEHYAKHRFEYDD